MEGLPADRERGEGFVKESAEFRRTHYRVYDADGFASSFALAPPGNATLESVSTFLVARFHGTGGTGFDSKDLVVLLGDRIVAVVRGGSDGRAEVTRFDTPPDPR